jgi:hypothetical protein
VRFDDETLALAFTPTPKQGLKSNPLDLAQLVVLKGPWRNPQVQLDPKGVLGMAATLGLATATAGASLLAQQLQQAQPETDACRVAMSASGDTAAPAPSASTTAPAGAAPAARPEALQKALPDALKRLLK